MYNICKGGHASYDRIIIGAGLYGLYAALFCAKQNEKVLVMEYDSAPFMRASYSNQARVHMGYHYPRSYSTAIKTASYFKRFSEDFAFCINGEFEKIYATSKYFSWTNAEQFRHFCKNANIPCDEVAPSKYFKIGMCDGAFVTKEYTYDAKMLKEFYLAELKHFSNVKILYNVRVAYIIKRATTYQITMQNGNVYETPFLLNATYASTNQLTHIIKNAGELPLFEIKYELCEVIICKVNEKLGGVGITVMDGPFFSIMPFGKTGYHSLTSVTFTPHETSFKILPEFVCQQKSRGYCSSEQLGNCNQCPAKPESAWGYMSNLARKYLTEEYRFKYVESLFSMKPILQASEIDDSRPTVVKIITKHPTLVNVLSGKINTVYDMDEVLKK